MTCKNDTNGQAAAQETSHEADVPHATRDYVENRSPNAPPAVPSIYSTPEDGVFLQWEDAVALEVHNVSHEWARDMAYRLLEAAGEEPISFKKRFGLDVSEDGSIVIRASQRSRYFTLSHDDIDKMIAELQEAKRKSFAEADTYRARKAEPVATA